MGDPYRWGDPKPPAARAVQLRRQYREANAENREFRAAWMRGDFDDPLPSAAPADPPAECQPEDPRTPEERLPLCLGS